MPYQTDKDHLKDISFDIKLRFEARRYYKIVGARRVFTAGELFGRWQNFNIRNSSFTSGIDIYTFTRASAHKRSAGMGFLIGISERLGAGFVLELYGGLGVRYISTTYYYAEHLTDAGQGAGFGALVANEDLINDTVYRPYLPLGAKICYLIPRLKR